MIYHSLASVTYSSPAPPTNGSLICGPLPGDRILCLPLSIAQSSVLSLLFIVKAIDPTLCLSCDLFPLLHIRRPDRDVLKLNVHYSRIPYLENSTVILSMTEAET